jgi:excisionase family DNA binding protein
MGGNRSNSNPYNHHPIADDGVAERVMAALAALAASIGQDGGDTGTGVDRLQGAVARLLSTATAPAPASRPPHDRRGYSVADLLRLYPVGKTKIYAEIKAGRLRPTKIGRRTMFTAEAVDDWLSTLQQTPAAKRSTAMDTPKAVAAESA